MTPAAEDHHAAEGRERTPVHASHASTFRATPHGLPWLTSTAVGAENRPLPASPRSARLLYRASASELRVREQVSRAPISRYAAR
jgi:hypothetical protein